jgi:hypothetical protein
MEAKQATEAKRREPEMLTREQLEQIEGGAMHWRGFVYTEEYGWIVRRP